MKQGIYNAHMIPDGKREILNGYLIWEDGKLTEVHEGVPDLRNDVDWMDAKCQMLLPGFIDIHMHGAMGKDLIEGTQEALDTVSRQLIEDGTTSFLASLTVLSHADTCKVLDGYAAMDLSGQGAQCLGIHAEGPYLSKTYHALMDERYLRDPDCAEIKEMIERSHDRIRMMTVAPELNGMETCIPFLCEHHITPMIGHSDATVQEVHRAFLHGAKGFTHLYNAMSQHVHRRPGCVTAAFLEKESFVELICDGFHVHPDIIRATFEICTPDRIILITDSMPGKGMPDKDYIFSGLHCHKQGIRVRVKETGRIAGSAIGMNDAVKNITKYTNCSLRDIVQMACVNPARCINVISFKGTLDAGKDADMILVDPDLNIRCTFVGGKKVYSG